MACPRLHSPAFPYALIRDRSVLADPAPLVFLGLVYNSRWPPVRSILQHRPNSPTGRSEPQLASRSQMERPTLSARAVTVIYSLKLVCAAFVLSFGLQVPTVAYSATSPTLSDPVAFEYLARVVPVDTMQAAAIIEVVAGFGWSRLCILCKPPPPQKNNTKPKRPKRKTSISLPPQGGWVGFMRRANSTTGF